MFLPQCERPSFTPTRCTNFTNLFWHENIASSWFYDKEICYDARSHERKEKISKTYGLNVLYVGCYGMYSTYEIPIELWCTLQ
jgi:hypothetical protein